MEPKVDPPKVEPPKVEPKETPSMYKNYGAPVLFVIIVPIILFYVLKKSTTVSQNIFPNWISVGVLVVFLVWGYASLRLFPQNFEGPKNVDGSVPKYQGNGFRFWIVSVILVIVVCLKWKEVPEMVTKNFIPIIMTFTAGTNLNDTICIKKIILTPTIKIWLYQLMLI